MMNLMVRSATGRYAKRGRKSADHRTPGNRVDASAGSTRQCGQRVRRRSCCGTVASGVDAWGELAGRAWRPHGRTPRVSRVAMEVSSLGGAKRARERPFGKAPWS